jgi:FkbM family methyltransferase
MFKSAAQWAAAAEVEAGDGLGLRFRRKFRRGLLRFTDPDVTYWLAGRPLLMPLSHELPRYRRIHPSYDQPLSHVARAVVDLQGQPVLVIDVGANVGDSAVLLVEAGARGVLCVEGLDGYLRLLRLNTTAMAEVVVAATFVTEDAAVLGGNPARGTAVLSASPAGAPSTTFDDLLAQYPDFAAAHLLKIDTDGWDLAILKSAASWLKTALPVLFFEHDPVLQAAQGYTASDVWQLLTDVGYRRIHVWSNTGVPLWRGALADAPTAVEDRLRDFPYLDVMAAVRDPLE